MNILLTYGSSGAHKLCFGNKNVYPCDAVAIYPHFMLIHTGNHFPSGSISPRSFVTKVMTHLRHTSLLLQWELAFSFPRMLQQSSRHKFIFTTDFWVKRRCFVFLLPLAVKVLFCMGDLMLAFCGVEFFLQVYMTVFNSFRRGEFKIVCSLVYEESYGNYPFVALVSCSQHLSLLGYATDAFW